MDIRIFNSFVEANEFAKSIAKNGAKPKLFREHDSFKVEYDAEIIPDDKQDEEWLGDVPF